MAKRTKSKITLKIIFATFSPWEGNKRSNTNGMIKPMISFFGPRTNTFTLLDQPHPGSDRVIPVIEIYENNQLKKTSRSSLMVSWLYPILILQNTLKTSLVFKIRDFLSVLDCTLRNRQNYDLFIGMESINTLAGVLMKKLGFIKYVIYYVSNFSLKYHPNPWFNKLFLYLDRVAFKQADFVWDVSQAIMPARIKAGLSLTNKTSIYVPTALFPRRIASQSKVIPLSLVYAGSINRENGADLAIKALKIVLRTFPKARLYIFASEDDTEIQNLRDLTDHLRIHDKVFFHGLIPDHTQLVKDLQQFKIGLAPYRAIPKSPSWWADATRIRLYLAAGLPVITTQVPPLGRELEQENSGTIVKDNPKQVAKAIISLFNNRTLYQKMKHNAIKRAQNDTWDKVYTRALKSMGIEATL